MSRFVDIARKTFRNIDVQYLAGETGAEVIDRTRYNYIANGTTPDDTRDDTRESGDGSYSYPLERAPKNTPEETERVERLIERVIEEHGETIEKLGDE